MSYSTSGKFHNDPYCFIGIDMRRKYMTNEAILLQKGTRILHLKDLKRNIKLQW